MKMSVTRRLKEVLLPLRCPSEECCVQFWSSQLMRERELLERVQQRTIKMIRGLECPSDEEKLKVIGLFSVRKGQLREDFC